MVIEHPRIVVSGSRTWGITSKDRKLGSPGWISRPERATAWAALNEVLEEFGHDLVIVHGTARGLDRYADTWAKERGITVEPHPADWDTLKNRAGMFRNAQMIATRTELVLAFHGHSHQNPKRLSSGTGGMITMVKARGIPIRVYRSPLFEEA